MENSRFPSTGSKVPKNDIFDLRNCENEDPGTKVASKREEYNRKSNETSLGP